VVERDLNLDIYPDDRYSREVNDTLEDLYEDSAYKDNKDEPPHSYIIVYIGRLVILIVEITLSKVIRVLDIYS
jgi:hypothetical protein